MEFKELKKFGKGLYYRVKGDCVFCKIVEKRDAEIVYETETVLAFAPLESGVVAEGHIVVIPKQHTENLFEIEKELLFQVMENVKKIASKLEEEYGGVNILNANGKAARQSVNHFHVHLVPRSSSENLDLWPETDYKEDSYEANYNKIREILN